MMRGVVLTLFGIIVLQSAPMAEALPEWERWQQVQEGQSAEEVIALLGEPESKSTITNAEVFSYGVVVPQARMFPAPLGFFIHLSQGKVTLKEQPFADEYALDGAPSVPKLIAPEDGIKMKHYPRYGDLRWAPSSGKQPVQYELKIEYSAPSSTDRVWASFPVVKTDIPYYPLIFVGSQPGRWKVRAVNDVGQSEWSEWRTFDWSMR